MIDRESNFLLFYLIAKVELGGVNAKYGEITVKRHIINKDFRTKDYYYED